MKPALHRSIVFWAGLLVMGFLGWAWRDSMRGQTFVRVGTFNASSLWGGLILENSPYAGARITDTEFARGPVPQYLRIQLERFPGVCFHGAGESTPEAPQSVREIIEKGNTLTMDAWLRTSVYPLRKGHWICFLPYWVLMLVCAVGWVGLLGWRTRRRRKREFEI